MYAKNLSLLLHSQLSEDGSYDQTLKRFEALRGYNQLPRGRENAGQRLSNEQVARAVLGFVPSLCRWAGHVALCMSNLRPVGGVDASFQGASTLVGAIAAILSDEDHCKALVSLTLSIARIPGNDEYHARIIFEDFDKRKSSNYVTKNALSLTARGAEKSYDHEYPLSSNTRQLVLGREFFRNLKSSVDLARHWDRPLETDWREYDEGEERDAFNKRLGARMNSNFLNLGVDTSVTWPKVPTRIEFGGHQFALFPKTKDNAYSISIDLQAERITSEEARTLFNRFLSVLSWCDDRHAILRGGWSGGHIPQPVPRRDMGGATMLHWMFHRSMPEGEQLLNCLSYYREGLNAAEAGIASQEVLSFFKVFEMKREGKPFKNSIAREFDEACSSVSETVMKRFHEDRGDVSIEDYIFDNCRIASAHASKKFPSDADMSSETQRLSVAGEVMQALARHHIRTCFQFSETYLSDKQS